MEYGGGLVEDCGGFGTMVGGETDMIEELLVEGCWVEASENNLMMMHHDDHMSSSTTPQPHYIPMGDNDEESGNFVVGKRWWIGPQANPGPSTSVKERLVLAVGYLKEYTKNSNSNSTSNSNSNSNSNVLIQIWVPLRRRSGLFHNQYHNPNPVHESLPISVPNSNVQVRFFRSHEYPRVQAHHGSLLALPVFERGTATCLGVIEFLIANQNLINYRPQLDHLSNALEAVDFTSNQNMIPPAVKVFEELYEAAVNEIVQVLASVCKTHNLPLALTWAPCIQQEGGGRGKGGCSNSNGNSNSNSNGSNNNNMMMSCVSTVDSACYIGDVDVLGFQEACSEYHLYNGQGIVGTAFTTTKPCFAIDITAFSKAEYPLAHHANMFGLHAAVAIPLRSVYTGSAADFVLEFFLPKDCLDTHQQKHMLNSLSLVVQQACRSLHLHVVMEDDHHNHNHHHLHHQHQHQHEEDQFTFPTTNIYMPSVDAAAAAPVVVLSQVEADASASASACSTKETTSSSCSWIAHMMEAQHKGKGVSVSLEYLQEPKEEFKVTTCNWEREREGNSVFSEFGQVLQQQQHEHQSMSNSRASTVVSVEGGEESGGGGGSGGGGRRSSCSSNGRKSGDKRRTKAEKTISLPVLRQYFAGSLKDAAKSIGVCPTTLKRICRQHGITRWPSRKIKKVGHSLKKLQLVIDSVQGAEGAIQIGSFYASFPELSSATGHSDQSSMKLMHNHGVSDHHNSFYGDGGVTTSNLKSPSSACSQTVGNQTNSTLINNNVVLTESNALASTDHAHAHAHAAALMQIRRTHSDAELLHHHTSNIDIQDYQLHDQDTKQLLLHFNKSQTLPPRPSTTTTTTNGYNNSLERGAFRVKATFADEKIRFSLQGMWCFRDLQVEIARRFNLNDMNNLVVKYLDDEGEWVVLACDGDLEECKDLHTSSHTRTIRLSLFQASPLNLHPNTFRNTSSSPPSSS